MSYSVVTAIFALGAAPRRMAGRAAFAPPAPAAAGGCGPPSGGTAGRVRCRRRGGLGKRGDGDRFFGLVVPGGLLANLALAPLATMVIVAGCLSLASASPAQRACRLFNGAASAPPAIHRSVDPARTPGAGHLSSRAFSRKLDRAGGPGRVRRLLPRGLRQPLEARPGRVVAPDSNRGTRACFRRQIRC